MLVAYGHWMASAHAYHMLCTAAAALCCLQGHVLRNVKSYLLLLRASHGSDRACTQQLLYCSTSCLVSRSVPPGLCVAGMSTSTVLAFHLGCRAGCLPTADIYVTYLRLSCCLCTASCLPVARPWQAGLEPVTRLPFFPSMLAHPFMARPESYHCQVRHLLGVFQLLQPCL
jgi:hypothetical protein